LNEERTQFIFIANDEFQEYELNEVETSFTITINFECESGADSYFLLRISLADVNNYAPEFSKTSYEIEIPTPLPKGYEVTLFFDEDITAIDYDLHNNDIEFSLTGSELFDVHAVKTGAKPKYVLTLLLLQQLTKLEGGEIQLMLTGTVSLK
jgi:hypothetical protein